MYRNHILFSIDDSSLKAGVKDVENVFKSELAKLNLLDEINVLETGTLGFFGRGVCAKVYPENVIYANIKPADIPELISEHFLKGRILKRLVLQSKNTSQIDLNYSKRIVLEHSGIIDPENIDEYLGVGGYEAWEKALTSMTQDAIIKEVKDSGLRGRGGAGFPTGLKWSFTAPLKAPQKYFVINADEGEPGTYKDRLIMEGDPHKLLEGIMISSYAIGATKAYIYVRGEYKLSIERLNKAIKQAKEYGLIGKNIFDSGFDLEIGIKVGAGAYVCGEETALIESLEGNRGNPRVKPPFPGVEGVWQKPTVVNNVETIANIPSIIKNGAKWYSEFGTDEVNGTKVYTIMGDVEVPGLCEVDMGTTLREIIDNYGGGMKEGKKFKAALVGGAAGVFLPEKLLDAKMDYNSLKEYSAVLGSGAILVMDESADIVEMLGSILKFFKHESCGKCSPCPRGNEILNKIIKKIIAGKGKEEDLDTMINVAEAMAKTSLCALGQSPIMPIKTAINNFREEFLAKNKSKK